MGLGPRSALQVARELHKPMSTPMMLVTVAKYICMVLYSFALWPTASGRGVQRLGVLWYMFSC